MARLVQVRPRSDAVVRFDEPDDWGVRAEGTWERVGRNQRLSLTRWRGRNPPTATFPVIVGDGTGFVDTQRHQLETWLRADGVQPPRLRVANASTWPFGDALFVVDDIDRSPVVDTLRVTKGGQHLLTRFGWTVTLLQYVEGDTLLTSRRAGGNQPAQPSKLRYQVKEGDTLISIAVAIFGDGSRWPDIAALNSIRDPRRLRVGDILHLPPR